MNVTGSQISISADIKSENDIALVIGAAGGSLTTLTSSSINMSVNMQAANNIINVNTGVSGTNGITINNSSITISGDITGATPLYSEFGDITGSGNSCIVNGERVTCP